MRISRIDNIGIAVRDLAGEARFFAEKLGFDVHEAPDAQPPSATVQVGGQYLYLFQTEDDSPAARRSSGLTDNPRGLDHVSFTVDDLDVAYRELRGRAVEFDQEPATVEDWGIRLASFRDPEGNSLFLVQSLPAG